MASRRRKKIAARADGYEPEFRALRKEVKDLTERIPGVVLGDSVVPTVPRGLRGIPIDFLKTMADVGADTPALREISNFDVSELRTKLAYYAQLAELRTLARGLLRVIDGTLEYTKAEMTVAALPAYAVAKALARNDPGASAHIDALRKAMRRAGRTGRKKQPKRQA
jgi:hypothetical protein